MNNTYQKSRQQETHIKFYVNIHCISSLRHLLVSLFECEVFSSLSLARSHFLYLYTHISSVCFFFSAYELSRECVFQTDCLSIVINLTYPFSPHFQLWFIEFVRVCIFMCVYIDWHIHNLTDEMCEIEF